MSSKITSYPSCPIKNAQMNVVVQNSVKYMFVVQNFIKIKILQHIKQPQSSNPYLTIISISCSSIEVNSRRKHTYQNGRIEKNPLLQKLTTYT